MDTSAIASSVMGRVPVTGVADVGAVVMMDWRKTFNWKYLLQIDDYLGQFGTYLAKDKSSFLRPPPNMPWNWCNGVCDGPRHSR